MPEKSLPPFTESQERFANVFLRVMSVLNTWAYRASKGRIGGRFLHGAPVLLLITRGRKTGRPRTAPLIYLRRGEDLFVVASKGGMSQHPAWYANLEADPEVEVEIGAQRIPMRASRLSDAEKAEIWPELLAVYRDYDDYQARTRRNIPVIRLAKR